MVADERPRNHAALLCNEPSCHLRHLHGDLTHVSPVCRLRKSARALAAARWSIELLRVELGHKVANKGDQFLSILHGIFKRIVAADEEARGTKFVIGEKRLRDRLRGADKRSRITTRARGLCELHP